MPRLLVLGSLLVGVLAPPAFAQDAFSAKLLDRNESFAQFGAAVAAGDFDGDGRDDLAVGMPRSTADGVAMSGRVLLYFNPFTSGSLNPPYVIVQDDAHREAFDQFGTTLAFGDFNGDGFDDLVVGTPYEDVGTIADAGAVNVYYGNRDRRAIWNQPTVFAQGMPFVQDRLPRILLDVPEQGDHFGQALAVGDFNGDGFDDLAIGVPGEDFLSPYLVGNNPIQLVDAGIVQVLYGAAGGLGASNEVWRQGRTLSMGEDFSYELPEAGDQFGYALAAGRFSGRASYDLAIGVPFEDLDAIDAGVVQVMYGAPGSGLGPYRTDTWDQARATRGLPSNATGSWPEQGDRFGFAVAGGDLNGDGIDDLAIGVPGEDVNNGGVHVLRGGVSWLTDSGVFWSRQQYSSQSGDEVGRTLTFGDFDGDGVFDLVVGVPGDDVWVSTPSGRVLVANAGSVRVTHGEHVPASSYQVFTPFNPSDLTQNDGTTIGLTTDLAETGDRYGSALAVGDFNGDGAFDLAIGIPGEDKLTTSLLYPDTGAVEVLPGYVY